MFNEFLLQKFVSNEFGTNDSLDSTKKDNKSDTLSTSSASDSIPPIESSMDEDPWAIVDMVDNSEKWEGMQRKIVFYNRQLKVTKCCFSTLYFYAQT